jgi:hypothetical protein
MDRPRQRPAALGARIAILSRKRKGPDVVFRFAQDSSLEGAGFEPSVPVRWATVRDPSCRLCDGSDLPKSSNALLIGSMMVESTLISQKGDRDALIHDLLPLTWLIAC